jgi:hypothetical protein
MGNILINKYPFNLRKVVFGCSVLILLFPGNSNSEQVNKSFLVRPWEVGQTVTLQTKTFSDGELTNTETTSYSIVGQESINGKDYFWFEIEKSGFNKADIIQKVQVRKPEYIDFENILMGDYSALTPRRIIKKIIIGDNKHLSSVNEFEVSPEAVSQIDNGPSPQETQDYSDSFEATPDLSIQVPAGSFKATKFHTLKKWPKANSQLTPTGGKSLSKKFSLESYAWGSPDVPIWGLIKKTSEGKDSSGQNFIRETELIQSQKSGAESKIKEEPRKMSLKEEQDLIPSSTISNTNFQNNQE